MNMYLLEFRATSIGFSIGIGVWVTQELNQLELKKKKKNPVFTSTQRRLGE